MDFNTRSGSGSPEDESRPLFSGEAGRRSPAVLREDQWVVWVRSSPCPTLLVASSEPFKACSSTPVGFFRGIARRGDFVNPAIFALICALISALLGGIISLALSPLFAGPGDTAGETLAGGVVGFVLTVILSPIYTAVGLLIGAGIYHLLVLLLVRPGNAGFEATFRVVCYAAAIQLISWIPIVNILAAIYGIVLSVFGIREVHSTTTGRAVAIVLIPVAVILLVIVLVGAALVAVFFGSQQL